MIDQDLLNKFLDSIKDDIDNDSFIEKFRILILNRLTQEDYKNLLEEEFK